MHRIGWLALVVALLVLPGCGDRRTSAMTPADVTSPSGRYVLDVFEDGPDVGFRVTDPDGMPVLAPAERWARRHRYAILWGEGDIVWAHSSDVGTTVWQPDGEDWKRALWVDTQLTPPATLRESFPREFP